MEFTNFDSFLNYRGHAQIYFLQTGSILVEPRITVHINYNLETPIHLSFQF